MYVVIVYDVDVRRVPKVCKFLRRYLHWVQNSVFEGEITEAKLEKLKLGLKKLLKEESDSVYIYKVRDQKWIDTEIMGQERSPTDTLI